MATITVTQGRTLEKQVRVKAFVALAQLSALRELYRQQDLYIAAAMAGTKVDSRFTEATRKALKRIAYLIKNANAKWPERNSVIVPASEWREGCGCLLIAGDGGWRKTIIPILTDEANLARFDKKRAIRVLTGDKYRLDDPT